MLTAPRWATTSASSNVVFYDGPWAVGSADRKPYTVDLHAADGHRVRRPAR